MKCYPKLSATVIIDTDIHDRLPDQRKVLYTRLSVCTVEAIPVGRGGFVESLHALTLAILVSNTTLGTIVSAKRVEVRFKYVPLAALVRICLCRKVMIPWARGTDQALNSFFRYPFLGSKTQFRFHLRIHVISPVASFCLGQLRVGVSEPRHRLSRQKT